MSKYERVTMRECPIYTGLTQRLWELENAIEDGQMFYVPCKKGDKAYFVTYKNGVKNIGVQGHEIKRIKAEVICKNTNGTGSTTLLLSDLGKDWFLTKEEALEYERLEMTKAWEKTDEIVRRKK